MNFLKYIFYVVNGSKSVYQKSKCGVKKQRVYFSELAGFAGVLS